MDDNGDDDDQNKQPQSSVAVVQDPNATLGKDAEAENIVKDEDGDDD